jgi:hypothetical protein
VTPSCYAVVLRLVLRRQYCPKYLFNSHSLTCPM